MQEEVRKAVQQAMQSRDTKVNELQAENAELKQLILAMIEANSSAGGVGGGIGPSAEGNRGAPTGRGEATGPPEGQRLPEQGDPRANREGDNRVFGAPPGLPVPSRRVLRDLGGQGGGQASGFEDASIPAARPDGGDTAECVTGKPYGAAGAASPRRADASVLDPDQSDKSPAAHMGLLAQGIQQLQQLQLKKDTQDPELLKGAVTLPALPEPYQDSSAVLFLEWIYETGQLVGSITDKATSWWNNNLELAKDAYHKFQNESPLKRLSIVAGNDDAVDGEKWARLEKRVMALLLASMSSSVKAEITMLRIDRVKHCLYKLYTIYAPGGASERASLIKQLEYIQPHGNIIDMIAALRRWKKLIGRAAEMGVSLPDGSVLLVAVEAAIKPVTEAQKDVNFKLNMAKNELGLPYKPALSSVLTYADHVIAELQQVIPYGKDQGVKLKGVTADNRAPSSASTSPTGKGQKQQSPCKFWSTDEGCRRGSNCKYAHNFATKEDKKARCWTCGSVNHRQQECPTKSGGKKGSKGGAEHRASGNSTTSTTSTAQVATLNNPQPSTIIPPTASTSATSTLENPSPTNAQAPTTSTTLGPTSTQPTSGSSGSSSATSTVLFSEQSNSGEIRELAEQFLAKIKRLAPMQAVTDNAVVDLELLLRSQGLGESHGMALLDSGASHAYRAPKTLEEVNEAKRVKVQLADGRHVLLRQTKGGTLLADDDSGGTILPLGSLVSSLGCKLDWSKRKGLRITHPEHGLLPTKLVGNTPVLRETEALQLIADLEQLELDKLEKNNTDGVLKMMSTEDSQLTWLDHLEEFVQKGERASLRRMLLDQDSPVDAVAEAEVVGLIGVDDRILLSDEAGAHYLKALPINRAMRKRLLKTRWVVHLYNGDEKGEEFARAESEDVTVIRMDVRDSKAYDLKTYGPAARLLKWAAARGQIEGIIGAPPRGAEHGPALFKRMLLVWLVANSGAVLNSLCAPFFCMEAPTWHPMWTSSAWIKFKDEMRFLKYHSVGTPSNMYFMASSLGLSDGMDIEEAAIMSLNYETPASSWPVPLKLGIAQAVLNWRRSDLRRHEATLCKIVGPRELNARDLAYWETHVRNNHVPYDRRCQTCVRASATGRAHRRCLTPSAYTLSLDICGPMRTRGESQEGKKFRYLLVGAYSHPRLDLPKDHKMPPVEEEDVVEPELDPFEEEDKPDDPPEEEDEEQKALNGDDIECQTLNFVVPMTSRTSKEVRAKIQHIYLQLRQQGLPLVRIHSDRGLELKAKETRSWMADRDILATTGESQQPQQNGRAEALVREIKRRVKVLLRTSGLPATCWPVAAEFAARRQRDLALGNYEDKDLAFGAPTHVKYKRFGEGGRYDLLERWKEGLFVGYSNDVKNGRVIRHGDGTYTTSVHIRPYLVDSDDLVQLGPHEVELPLPERRTRGKTTLAKALADADNDIDNLAKSFLDNNQFKPEHVVELWKYLKAKARPTSRTTQGEGLQWLIGQYTYGSQCGIVNDTYLHPTATSYLVRAFKEITGRDDFTALLLTENVGMKCHRDVHNNGARSNWLLPLLPCDEGGGVWMESSPENYSYDDEWRELPRGGWKRGRVHELQPGVPLEINPRRYHATEPWVGTRLVITAYTPRTTSMKPDTYEILCEFGFNPPPLPPRVPDQLQQTVLKMLTMTKAKDEPEAVMFLVNEVEEEKRERARDVSRELQQLQDDVLGRLKERREWLREFLAEEEILAEELNVVGPHRPDSLNARPGLAGGTGLLPLKVPGLERDDQ